MNDELYEAAFAGHGRGVVISHDSHGKLSERPMTAAEREARPWALAIARAIESGREIHSYHRIWEFVALIIAQKEADARSCSKCSELSEKP